MPPTSLPPDDHSKALDADLLTPPPVDDDAPPILESWPQLYAFVLIFHTLLILAFYLFSRSYAV